MADEVKLKGAILLGFEGGSMSGLPLSSSERGLFFLMIAIRDLILITFDHFGADF
jgi:hypothetical protein